MWNNKELKARFAALLKNVGLEPRSYSGRNMYGATCVAVPVDNTNSMGYIGAMLALAIVQHANNSGDDGEDTDALCGEIRDCIDELTGVLENGTRSDSLGRGIIVYWQDIKWSEQVDFDGKPFDANDDEG